MALEPEPRRSQLEVARFLPAVSVAALYGRLPMQSEFRNNSEGLYREIAAREIRPTVMTDGSMVFVGPPIRGMELQALFHFAAPSKSYGDFEFDYADTQQDWRSIYGPGESAKRRLAGHRRIPGWDIFEKHRERLLDFIREDHDKAPHQAIDHVRPVIHLTDNEFGLDDLDDATADMLGLNPGEGVPFLGPLLVAAYSPAITSTWPERLNYGLKSTGEKTNNMGPTQVLPLTITWRSELMGSGLVGNMVDYCTTGELPQWFPETATRWTNADPDNLFYAGTQPQDIPTDASIAVLAGKYDQKENLKIYSSHAIETPPENLPELFTNLKSGPLYDTTLVEQHLKSTVNKYNKIPLFKDSSNSTI